MTSYLEKNKASWNVKTDVHIQSEFYDINGFLNGASSLNDIEINLLGDIKGKDILHLQCHFGQDSISLARMGAHVTGVDLSDRAIDTARQLSKQCKVDTDFVCCDVYELPKHLDKKFDLVFTTYGTIGWLPDLNKWGHTISHFLKPGGKLIFVEFHPVVWMFDNHFEKFAYSYFNVEEIIEQEEGTYADKSAPIKTETVSWNHSLSEVMQGLLSNGIEVNSFEEFDYSPYNCFNNTVKVDEKKYRIKGMEGKLPMLYTIVATKK